MGSLHAILRSYAEDCSQISDQLRGIGASRGEPKLHDVLEIFPKVPQSWEGSSVHPVLRLLEHRERLGPLQSSNQWLNPLLDTQLVPKAALLLSRVVENAAMVTKVAANHPELAARDGEEIVFMICTLTTASSFILVRAAQCAAGAVEDRRPDDQQNGKQILSQLSAPGTLAVLAKAVGYAERTVWPRAGGLATASDVVSMEPASTMLLHIADIVATIFTSSQPPSLMHQMLSSLQQANVDADAPMSRDAMEAMALRCWAPENLSRVAAANVSSASEPSRVLTALRTSGIMTALSSALLAAPPCPPVPADAKELDPYTHNITSVLLHTFNTSEQLQAYTGPCAPLVIDLLAAPEVRRLLWTGVERVAALGEEHRGAAGQAAGPAAAASASSQAADPGPSRQVPAPAQAPPHCWPLLQPHVLGHIAGSQFTLADICAKILEAASVGARLQLISQGVNLPNLFSTRDVATTAAAAAARTMPPRREAAALAARAMGVLCAKYERGEPSISYDSGLIVCVLQGMDHAVTLRMCGTGGGGRASRARGEEVAACMPDLLECHGWVLRAHTRPQTLADATAPSLARAADSLFRRLAGVDESAAEPEPSDPHKVWSQLSFTVQTECARRLVATRLLPSLDSLFRALVAKDLGAGGDSIRSFLRGIYCVPVMATAVLRTQLLPPLGDQTGQAGSAASTAASTAADSAAGAPSCSQGRSGGGGDWRPADALGAIVSLAKLAGLLAARLTAASSSSSGSAAAGAGAGCRAGTRGPLPDFLRTCPTHYELAALLIDAGCGRNSTGVMELLPQIETAAAAAAAAEASPTSGSAAATTSSSRPAATAANLTEAAALLPELSALCCRTAVPLLTGLMEQAAGYIERWGLPAAASTARQAPSSPYGGDDESRPVGQGELMDRLLVVGDRLGWVLERMPPAEVRAVAPQRALAALGRLLLWLRGQQTGGSRGAGVGAGGSRAEQRRLGQFLEQAQAGVTTAVVVLSANEELQEACVPGWFWCDLSSPAPAPPASDTGPPLGRNVNLSALAAVSAGNPMPSSSVPIITVGMELVRGKLGTLRWEDHKQHTGAVAEAAREALRHMEAASMAVGRPNLAGALQQVLHGEGVVGGGRVLWPPAALRLCGNRRCANFGGESEAALKLKQCGGCRAVRYCGAECQRQHFREGGHKQECKELAEARSGGRAGAAGPSG